MKRISSYILTCILIISCVCANFVFASTSNMLKISDALAVAGQEFSLDLEITSVEKIVALETRIEYDSEVFEIVSVSANDEVFSKDCYMGSENLDANPYYLSWDNSLGEQKCANGVLATIVFKVNKNAYNGDYAITPTIQPDGAFDEDLCDVLYETQAGCVTVSGGIEPTSPITTSTTAPQPTELTMNI